MSASARSIPSPLTTQIPNLSPEQIAALPYPPDYYPGARDVKTPYGSMRVYEWGPAGGRKVVLVHGDATCAPVWKRVAEGLVERGARVCVIDLWGRGYTDTPLVPHTSTLLSLQILFAASSSPLPWCTETFSVVGFSLGGGIAMDFVASFPHLVRSAALLAPAGMIRTLPGVYVDFKNAVRGGGKTDGELNGMLAGVLGVEGSGEGEFDRLVRWQYEKHQGHARSFASTLVHGPVVGQGDVWREACGVLKEKKKVEGRERLVVVCGEDDWVVRKEWVREDLDGMMGEGEYVFGTVQGGHGFLVDESACEKVVETIGREWGL